MSETSENRPDNQARARVYLAPSASNETEKEQEATDISHAWLEQLAINLPEVDEEEKWIQRENHQRNPRLPETELWRLTGIFRLADVLKPASKEDYEGKWFSNLLTDHTFEVKYDQRMVVGCDSIVFYINVVGLQGIIPDRAQVAIIQHHYHPSIFSIATGRVRNYRLRKSTMHEFGSYLWINEPNRYQFNDYRVLSSQTPSVPLVAPSSTWNQVHEHLKENKKSAKWEISRGSSRNTKFFRVWQNQEVAQIGWTFQGNAFCFESQVLYFLHDRYWKFKQDSVFLMSWKIEELGDIFEW